MKVLNLCAGLGGNRMKWEGVEVVAVENNEEIANIYKQNNPNDDVIVGDAHDFLRKNYEDFDFIWSSPPCQKHSKMMKATRHKVADYIDLMLYQQIIFLQHFYKGGWVVENVKPYYKPLIAPSNIMGRHCFWSNFVMFDIEVETPFRFMDGTTDKSEQIKKWLGIEYEGNVYYGGNHDPCQVLRNCVHPEMGRHILNSYVDGLVGG